MERGVEDRYLRHVGPCLAHRLDPEQRRRVVQRGQRTELLDRGDHVVVDDDRVGELLATMHDPVADAAGLLRRPAAGWPRRGSPCDRRVVVALVEVPFLARSAAASDVQSRLLGADALDDAGHRAIAAVGVDEHELERRAARVEDEDVAAASLRRSSAPSRVVRPALDVATLVTPDQPRQHVADA